MTAAVIAEANAQRVGLTQAEPSLPQGSSAGAPDAPRTGAADSQADFVVQLSSASTSRGASGEEPTTSATGRRESVGSVLSVESVLSLPKGLAARILASPSFDACIGVVILVNAVAIGAEQSLDLSGADISAFAIMEHVFLIIYVLELLVRCIATSGRCISDNWVRFDLLFVGTGVVCFWIVFPILGEVKELEPFYMLRLLRLLRLARAVRLIALFRELWMLVQGFLVSARTMVYTIGLIAVILYLFAVVAIEVITKHDLADPVAGDPVFHSVVDQSFNSLPQTMMTLLQFVSFDNVVVIYEPLIKRDWRLAIFFISIIVIVGILLMNLVTAVVVNSALEQAMADKELSQKQEENSKKKMCKELRKLFIRLDEDASGQVTMDEIGEIAEEDKQTLTRMLGLSDPLELFRALDVDGSGEVDIEEFCNGIWQVCISKAPIEIKRVEKMVEAMRHQLRVSEIVMADMVKVVGDLRDQFDEKIRLLSSSASVATPGAPESGDVFCAAGRQAEQRSARPAGGSPSPARSARSAPKGSNGSSSWDQAPLMEEVQADCDGQLASGIQACVRDAVGAALRDLQSGSAVAVAVHGGFGAGAAQQVAQDARLGCIQTSGEAFSFGSDISTAPGWVEELTFELRSLRATGLKVALSEAHAGPKTQAQGVLTAGLLRSLTKASRSSSKDAKSHDGSLSPTRHRMEAHAAVSSTNSGARHPNAPAPKAAPRRAKPEDSGAPAREAATSSSRRTGPPRNRSPARAPEALPEGASAPEAPTSREATAARRPAAGASVAASSAGRAGPLARGLPAGPAEVHHL